MRSARPRHDPRAGSTRKPSRGRPLRSKNSMLVPRVELTAASAADGIRVVSGLELRARIADGKDAVAAPIDDLDRVFESNVAGRAARLQTDVETDERWNRLRNVFVGVRRIAVPVLHVEDVVHQVDALV